MKNINYLTEKYCYYCQQVKLIKDFEIYHGRKRRSCNACNEENIKLAKANSKRCFCCREIKLLEKFDSYRGSETVKSAKCQDCKFKLTKFVKDGYYAFDRNGIKYKKCSECETEKTISEFTINNALIDKVSSKCKPCMSKIAWAARQRDLVGSMFYAARMRAKEKQIEFNIDESDLGEIPEFCPVLGIKIISELNGGRLDSSATLDRIDNSKGYKKGNVMIISWRANSLKNVGTAEEHEKIAIYMRKHGCP